MKKLLFIGLFVSVQSIQASEKSDTIIYFEMSKKAVDACSDLERNNSSDRTGFKEFEGIKKIEGQIDNYVTEIGEAWLKQHSNSITTKHSFEKKEMILRYDKGQDTYYATMQIVAISKKFTKKKQEILTFDGLYLKGIYEQLPYITKVTTETEKRAFDKQEKLNDGLKKEYSKEEENRNALEILAMTKNKKEEAFEPTAPALDE